MEMQHFIHAATGIIGNNYADAINEVNERIQTKLPDETSIDKKARAIFDGVNEFYAEEKGSMLYKAVTQIGEPCWDKTLNLVIVNNLNGIRTTQYQADDLILDHTSPAITDPMGTIIRHIEATNPEGFDHNIYPDKPPKGVVYGLDETLDILHCQLANNKKSSNLKGAASILTGVINKDPSLALPLYMNAKINYDLNDYDASIASLERFLEKIPDNPHANLTLGLAYKGKNEIAIIQFTKAKEEADRLLLKYTPHFDYRFKSIKEQAEEEIKKIEEIFSGLITLTNF